MSVLANVTLAPRRVLGMPQAAAEEQARELLARFGLAWPPERRSGYSKSGMTMVISTHEMGFARQIADRVCFMNEGVILEQGPPYLIFHAPRQERTAAFLKRVIEAGRAADLAAEM